MRAEHDIGDGCGQIHAVIRSARLYENRIALWTARYVERALDRKELPFVIERMKFFWMENEARLLVADKGVVIPAIPKSSDDLDGFMSAVITLGMAVGFFAPKVLSFHDGRRGHD